MTSWIRLWPLLLMPYVVMLGIGLMPTVHLFGRDLGGPYVREWVLNTWVLPWMPQDSAITLVGWFAKASPLQEMWLHALIMLNLYALLFPVLLGTGALVIRYSVWSTATDLVLKRRALRR